MRTLRTIKSVPTHRVFTQLGRGSRTYQYNHEGEIRGGPGDPPPDFLVATNSITEWYVYWGMFKALEIPFDPRKSGPPFMGWMPDFAYQLPMQGGRTLPGGAVPDFVVYRTWTGVPVIIRVVTEFFHIFTSNAKQVSDAFQKQRLEDEVDVIDVYDSDFTHDPTGQAVIQVLKRAVGLIERGDPLRAGTAMRNRRR